MAKFVFSYNDLLEKARDDLKWYVPGFLPEGAVTLLAGEAGSGKSFLALDLSIALATGRAAWHPGTCPPARVLYFCQDSSRFQLGKRVQSLTAHLSEEEKQLLNTNLAFNFSSFSLGSLSRMGILLEHYKNNVSHLIVLDVLTRYLPKMSDTSVTVIGPILTFFKEMVEIEVADHRLSILVLHHLNKRSAAKSPSLFADSDSLNPGTIDPNRVRGSSDIVANVDLVWGLHRSGENRILTPIKNRLCAEPVDQPAFRIVQDGESVRLDYQILPYTPPEPKGVEEIALQGLLQILQENPNTWFTRQELITGLETHQPLPGQRALSIAFSNLRHFPNISIERTQKGINYLLNSDEFSEE